MLLIPRFLAMLVDYLLIFSLLMLFGKFLPNPDLQWQLAFILGAIYFSACHSKFFGGYTLGKRAFGLRVIDIPTQGPLCFGQAFFRYFFTYGLIILLSELPPVYFRNHRIEAAPGWLEFNMLLALCYFGFLILSVLLSNSRRGFHDQLSGSMVLRNEETSAGIAEDSKRYVKLAGAAVLSAVISYFVWHQGIPRDRTERLIFSKRYVLEHDLNLRFLRIQIANKQLEIQMLLVDSNTIEATSKELVNEIRKFISSAPFTRVHFQVVQTAAVSPKLKEFDIPFYPQAE